MADNEKNDGISPEGGKTVFKHEGSTNKDPGKRSDGKTVFKHEGNTDKVDEIRQAIEGGNETKTIVHADTIDSQPKNKDSEPTIILDQPSISDALLETPSHTKRYKLQRLLGRGGMGEVHLAWDVVLERHVAIKFMILGKDITNSAKERFLRESRLGGRLEHPNIVPLHDIGYLEFKGKKCLFMSQKYIEGRDLGDIIEKLPINDTDLKQYDQYGMLQVFLQVLRGMGFAHDKDVIHRDIKPDNIMVGTYGEVYVVDWGLAKIKGLPDIVGKSNHPSSSSSSSLTKDGSIMGTPSYMPPEQASGELEKIDHRADIYSLGGTLYFMLTGIPPFSGTDVWDIISDVQSKPPTPPTEALASYIQTLPERLRPRIPATIPHELEEIVLRSLEKEPDDRFQSAMGFSQAITSYLRGVYGQTERRARGLTQRFKRKDAIGKWKALIGMYEKDVEDLEGKGNQGLNPELVAVRLKITDGLFELAKEYQRLNKHDEVKETYAKALETLKGPSKEVLRLTVRAMTNMGLSYYLSMQYNDAIDWFDNSAKLSGEYGFHDIAGIAYINQAESFARLKNLDDALKSLDKGYAAYEKIGDKDNMAKALIGKIMYLAIIPERAHEAKDIIEKIPALTENLEILALFGSAEGEFYEQTNKHEKARLAYKRGLMLAEQIDFKNIVVSTGVGLAKHYLLMQDYDNARKYLDKVFSIQAIQGSDAVVGVINNFITAHKLDVPKDITALLKNQGN